MNINSQELMLINRNMKLRAKEAPVPTTASPEAPISNPNGKMSALDAMAQNNMTFQGVKMAGTPHLKTLKEKALTLLLAGTMAMTTLTTMTSCEKDQISQNVDVNNI